MKKRIHIIDDDPEVVSIVKEALIEEGFSVDSSGSADKGVLAVKRVKPDLVILDLMLPGISGLEVCRILREDKGTSSIPIIIMTGGAVNAEDKVIGLEKGADDYITKPFLTAELMARVKAIFRRARYEKEPERVLRSGGLVLNVDQRKVWVGNRPVKIRAREFDLLLALMERRERVLTRAALMERVWGYEYFGSSRCVDIAIARLRKELGQEGAKIETVKGVGYRFSNGK